MFACFAPLSIFLLVCRFFCFFARSVAVPSVVPNSQYSFNSTAPTRTAAAFDVPVTTYEGCCCCLHLWSHLGRPQNKKVTFGNSCYNDMIYSLVLLGCSVVVPRQPVINSRSLCVDLLSYLVVITQRRRLYEHSDTCLKFPLWRSVQFFIRAKRVSNCYMQEKKNWPFVCLSGCSANLLVLVRKKCLGFTVGYQRAPGWF